MAQKVTPFLWFDRDGEQAVEFYVSLFANSSIRSVSRYGEGAPLPAGTAFVIDFTLDGVAFRAMNAGPGHPFTDAFSLSVEAPSQQEIDRLWDGLTSQGGAAGPCGWLTDRWGLSWQIVPPVLSELLGGPDQAGAARAMNAMLGMGKLEIAALQAAYDGR